VSKNGTVKGGSLSETAVMCRGTDEMEGTQKGAKEDHKKASAGGGTSGEGKFRVSESHLLETSLGPRLEKKEAEKSVST